MISSEHSSLAIIIHLIPLDYRMRLPLMEFLNNSQKRIFIKCRPYSLQKQHTMRALIEFSICVTLAIEGVSELVSSSIIVSSSTALPLTCMTFIMVSHSEH